jgi:hypothetical protein
MREKSKSAKDEAQPMSKQKKEALICSAQLLSKGRPNFNGYNKIK